MQLSLQANPIESKETRSITMKRKLITGIMIATTMMFVTAGCGSTQGTVSDDGKRAAEGTTQIEAQAEQTEATAAQPETTETKPAKEATTEIKTEAMYTTEDLNLLDRADDDAKVIVVVPVNSKVDALESDTEWTHVKYKGKEGYLHTEYLTKNSDEAEQAKVNKEEEERAAEEEAGQEEAEKDNDDDEDDQDDRDDDEDRDDEDNHDDEDDDDDDEKKVVKKEKFEDCDGSGHGYVEITYSDGSTEVEDY